MRSVNIWDMTHTDPSYRGTPASILIKQMLLLFLPKFHCKLNFIEYFWGQVKKYLRDNCDYTFDTLKDNMPIALASVPLQTIWRWEHRMYRWMDAYRMGLRTVDAQLQVKKF
jgi:hypothetical protein